MYPGAERPGAALRLWRTGIRARRRPQSRPFQGVGRIVHKLRDIVEPDQLFYGAKRPAAMPGCETFVKIDPVPG